MHKRLNKNTTLFLVDRFLFLVLCGFDLLFACVFFSFIFCDSRLQCSFSRSVAYFLFCRTSHNIVVFIVSTYCVECGFCYCYFFRQNILFFSSTQLLMSLLQTREEEKSWCTICKWWKKEDDKQHTKREQTKSNNTRSETSKKDWKNVWRNQKSVVKTYTTLYCN